MKGVQEDTVLSKTLSSCHQDYLCTQGLFIGVTTKTSLEFISFLPISTAQV